MYRCSSLAFTGESLNCFGQISEVLEIFQLCTLKSESKKCYRVSTNPMESSCVDGLLILCTVYIFLCPVFTCTFIEIRNV